ncbi:MAG: hypothetical protein IPM29_02820 [Planctomycetes bacterium]|nr:hypothetical protein [Planctomycetota bacterium]
MGPLVGSGCNARVTYPVPVPLDYALCDGVLCFQGVVLCVNAPVPGLSLTNALQIVVD